MIKKVLLTVLALTLALSAFGQSLEDNLQSMLQTNAEMYLQPFGEAFGANMNSALYHRSRVHKILGFDFGVKTMWAAIPQEALTFQWDLLPENKIEYDLSEIYAGIDPIELGFNDIYDSTSTTTSTFFGSKEGGKLLVDDANLVATFTDHIRNGLVANGMNAAQVTATITAISGNISSYVESLPDLPLPPGIGLEEGVPMPMVMPQASIGLPMGIELMIRGVPDIDLPEGMGTFNLIGGGARLNLDQFIPIPLFPVDITAGAFFQQMNIGEIVQTTNTSFNMQVGKSLSLLFFGLGVYADVAYDASTFSIAYDADFLPDDPDNELTHIEFDLDTEPGMRFGGGLHITAIPLTYISLGFSQTPTNQIYTLSAGLTLR